MIRFINMAGEQQIPKLLLVCQCRSVTKILSVFFVPFAPRWQEKKRHKDTKSRRIHKPQKYGYPKLNEINVFVIKVTFLLVVKQEARLCSTWLLGFFESEQIKGLFTEILLKKDNC